jgi:hypothetical protein
MAGKNTAVFGIYTTRSSVDRAVEALKAAGFSNNDVSALFPENQGTKDFAHEKNTKAPEGATTGAGTGALLGGGLGWLTGIGALAIPGLGPFIAAGPIMAEAKRYEGRVKDGGILLSVHSDSSQETKRAKEILERTGAQDFASTGEASSEKAAVPRRDVA